MQPNVPENNGVWISREEYERLKQTPVTNAAPQAGSVTPAVFEPVVAKHGRNVQILVGFLLAAGIYVSLTIGAPGFLIACLLVLAASYVTVTAIDMLRSRSKDTAHVRSTNHRGVYKTLGIIALIVVAAPLLFYVGMVLLFLIVFSLGGGRGS